MTTGTLYTIEAIEIDMFFYVTSLYLDAIRISHMMRLVRCELT
jgi:hypothetical protein